MNGNKRKNQRGVGENFPHVFGVTASVASAIGAEPLWGARSETRSDWSEVRILLGPAEKLYKPVFGRLAQLVRAPHSHCGGQRSESSIAHH